MNYPEHGIFHKLTLALEYLHYVLSRNVYFTPEDVRMERRDAMKHDDAITQIVLHVATCND